MSARSPDILMDPTTGDLPDFSRHVSGSSIIAQRVHCRLTTLLGDWPLDTSAGVDWIGIFGTKPFDADGVAAVLAVEMTETTGVTGITDIVAAQSGRSFTMTCTLLTALANTIAVVIEPTGIDGNLSITVGGIIGHSGRIIS